MRISNDSDFLLLITTTFISAYSLYFRTKNSTYFLLDTNLQITTQIIVFTFQHLPIDWCKKFEIGIMELDFIMNNESLTSYHLRKMLYIYFFASSTKCLNLANFSLFFVLFISSGGGRVRGIISYPNLEV